MLAQSSLTQIHRNDRINRVTLLSSCDQMLKNQLECINGWAEPLCRREGGNHVVSAFQKGMGMEGYI